MIQIVIKFYQNTIGKGLPPILLGFLYMLVSVTPILIISFNALPSRSVPNELATHLGLLAYMWILLSFLLSGRFKSISGKIGIDATIRFHQFKAIVLGIFLFFHPYFYTLSISPPVPWDSTRQFSLLLTYPAFIGGMLTWIVVLVLILISIFRDQLPFRYETWRFFHGLAAVIVVVGSTIHVFDIGRYTQSSALIQFLWISIIVLASFTLLRTYLILLLLQKRRPFKVVSVVPASDNTWHLTIVSNSLWKFKFTAGQFAWIKLNKPAFGIEENPFSISSAPSELPEIRFTIKEAGDTTNKINSFKPNDLVYLDGPHGHFIIEDRKFDGVFMIAGGIGIAPLISIIKEMANNNDQRPVKLLYGNRLESQITFQEELTECSRKLDFETLYVLSEPPKDWKGLSGVMDNKLLTKQLKTIEAPGDWLFLLCGPPIMTDSAIQTLKSFGIRDDQIRFEKFTYL